MVRTSLPVHGRQLGTTPCPKVWDHKVNRLADAYGEEAVAGIHPFAHAADREKRGVERRKGSRPLFPSPQMFAAMAVR